MTAEEVNPMPPAHANTEPDLWDELVAAFGSAVPHSFGFLTRDLGFTLRRPRSTVFVGVGPTCRLRWLYPDWTVLVIDIRPRRWLGFRYRLGPVSLDVLLESLGAEKASALRTCLSDVHAQRALRPQDVTKLLSDYAAAMQRHAEPFLHGDFSAWPTRRRLKQIEATFR